MDKMGIHCCIFTGCQIEIETIQSIPRFEVMLELDLMLSVVSSVNLSWVRIPDLPFLAFLDFLVFFVASNFLAF